MLDILQAEAGKKEIFGNILDIYTYIEREKETGYPDWISCFSEYPVGCPYQIINLIKCLKQIKYMFRPILDNGFT